MESFKATQHPMTVRVIEYRDGKFACRTGR